MSSARRTSPPGGGPGRPRADLERPILDATLALLATHGYQRLTMGDVAAAAGVGKPTLYRRFASKAALVAATLVSLGGDVDRPELPAGSRAALGALLRGTAEAIARPGTMTILGSLLAEVGTDPELLAAFRDALFEPQHEVVHATLRRGIERGEVRPDLDVDAIDALLFGSLVARALIGEPVDDAWAARVIEAAWPAIGVLDRSDA